MKGKINLLAILIITLLTTFLGVKSINAETEKIRRGEDIPGPYYITHIRGSHYLWDKSKFIVRQSDGAFVYCVQPLVLVNSDSTYTMTTEDMANVAKIDYDTWKKIERVAYYGYGYKVGSIDHTSPKWYAATQMIIWQLSDPTVESFFTGSLQGKRDDSILADEMNEIKELANSHTKKPNLSNLPEKLTVNNPITISDENAVLSQYTLENVVGGNVTVNGNDITITPTEVGSLSFELNRFGNRYGEPTRLYYAVDSQNVVIRGNIDPIRTKYNMTVSGGKVSLEKLDSETRTNIPLSDEASLEGAVYGIHQEDGTRVGSLTTDKDGKAISDFLPGPGKYFLLEEIPSKGYQLDTNRYFFEIKEDNLNPVIKVYEKIITRDFDITKVYSSENTGIMTPEKGITFKILNSKKEFVKEVITDSQGNIKFSLPYGTYTVKQITSTPGYEKVDDFQLVVKETGTIIKKVIANAGIKAKLKVVKIDAETKEVIKRKNIKFKIYDVNNEKYVCQTVTYPNKATYCVFETDDNGEFITPYALATGKYRLEEVDQAIEGYLWNNISHEFSISEDSKLITDSDYGIIFEMSFENHPVKGSVEIKKFGEVIHITEEGLKFFKKPLEGILYGIYANEDIKLNGKTIYKKGTKIGEQRTNKSGYIKFNNLYLGSYFVQELETLDDYVLDTTKYEFNIKYENQYTANVICSKTLLNFLKTGKLEFTKMDISESEVIPNALIEIYNQNDILVYRNRTNENGQIIIERLPLGKYYFVEREAPEGYLINNEKMYFEILENGEVIKAILHDEKEITVPKTGKNDYHVETILGITIIFIGTSIILYEKKKRA